MPDSVDCRNGLASCQHSRVDSPSAAVRAVRLRCGVVRVLSCAAAGSARLARVRVEARNNMSICRWGS